MGIARTEVELRGGAMKKGACRLRSAGPAGEEVMAST